MWFIRRCDIVRVILERGALGLDVFNVKHSGVHMTIYEDGEDGLNIWVPTRSKTKQTSVAVANINHNCVP
jgi:hypothetical protein